MRCIYLIHQTFISSIAKPSTPALTVKETDAQSMINPNAAWISMVGKIENIPIIIPIMIHRF